MKRDPEEITVIEVLEAVEDIRRLTKQCVLGLDECNDEVSCPLHNTWKQFRESLIERLRTMNVSDLVLELERKRRHLGARRGGAGDELEAVISDPEAQAGGS